MNIQLAPQDYYYEIQQAAENKMSKISLQDILDSYKKNIIVKQRASHFLTYSPSCYFHW